MKMKNIYKYILGLLILGVLMVYPSYNTHAQTADGACSAGATALEQNCTFQQGASRRSGKCQVKDPANPSLGLTCKTNLGSPCSGLGGNTCENGLVCISNVCTSPRGTKTENQSCSGNECSPGLECRNSVCVRESTLSGTTPPNTTPGGSGTSSVAGNPGSETGLVKCGVSRDCTICDIFILIRDIFTFALGLLASLAVLSMVIGGIYILVSAGNSGMVSQGYSIITNAVVGLLLVMASFLLFSFLLVGLGFQEANFSSVLTFRPGEIFEVKCDSASTFNDDGQNGGGQATSPSTPGGSSSTGIENVACLDDKSITGELSAVMRAISYYEANGGAASGYSLGQRSDSGAFGRYQMIPSTWRDWAAKANVNPNDRSPSNQDQAVAGYLRREQLTTCDAFAQSGQRDTCSFNGACQWTPIPGCAACNRTVPGLGNTRYGQPNDFTRAQPDFAAFCKRLDADTCP